MEIQNQNSINVTQERLDEMKAIKDADQKVLDDINNKGAALSRDKAAFAEYKTSETTKIEDARKLLARESANHQNLDTVKLQNQIDDLTKENADLTAQVDDLNKKNQSLTQEIIDLKKK